MRADTDTPAEVADGVVGARPACMADTLEGVAGDGTEGGSSVTGAHVDGIGGMAEVIDAGVDAGLVGANPVARWRWEAEAGGGQSVWEGFKGEGWQAVCQA